MGVTAVCLTAGTVVAQSSAAGAVPVASGCANLDGRHVEWGAASTVTDAFDVGSAFAAGDVTTVAVTVASGSGTAELRVPYGSSAIAAGPVPGTVSGSVAGGTADGLGRVVVTLGSPSAGALDYTCTPAREAGGTAPIPDWVQAYGIFHPGDPCATGWTNSWNAWAEPITGGWVCTRTVPSVGG